MTFKRQFILLISFILAISPLSFLGFDFTDLGYHIMNEYQAMTMGAKHLLYNPYWGGADIVGGWWLKVINSELWLIRLSAVIIFSFQFFIILNQKAVSQYSLLILAISLLSTTPMTVGMVFIADYYTLPTLLLTIWSVLWIKLNQGAVWYQLVMLIIITASIGFLRLPLYVLFLAPFIFIFDRNKWKFLFIWIFSSIALFIILNQVGYTNLIIEGLKKQKHNIQIFSSFRDFIKSFLNDLVANLIFLLEVSLGSFLLSRVTKYKFDQVLIVLLVLLFSIGVFYPMELFESVPLIQSLAKTSFKRVGITIHLLMLFYCFYRLYFDRTLITTYLPILLLPFLLIAGTNTGLMKLNYLILVTFLVFSNFYKVKISKYLVLIFSISALIWNYSRFYKEGSILDISPSPIKEGKLTNIYTSYKSKEKLVEIESFLQENDLNGKAILAYPNLASIYYLNNSPMYLNYPWPYFLKKSILFDSIKRDCKNNTLRAVIIEDSRYDSQTISEKVKSYCKVRSLERKNALTFILLTSQSPKIKN